MSDTMLFAVLQMPMEMVMATKMSQYQFYQRVQEALNRMIIAEAKLDAIQNVSPKMIAAAKPWLSQYHHMNHATKEANLEEAIKAASQVAIDKIDLMTMNEVMQYEFKSHPLID